MSKSYTPSQVSTHKSEDDIWIIISNEVYDMTEFQHTHPGGAKILKTVAGRDATKPFKKIHNERILKSFQFKHLCIGAVTSDPDVPVQKTGFSKLFSWGSKKTAVIEVKVVEMSSGSSYVGKDHLVEAKVVKLETVDEKLRDLKDGEREEGGGDGGKALEGRRMCDVIVKDIGIVAL